MTGPDHDLAPGDVKYVEPKHGENSGTMVVRRRLTPYQRFMSGEGVPIYNGPGIHDVRELELVPWSRIGGRGCFIDLDGTTDLLGLQVVEIPPGGVLEPQQHLYEEKYFVVEGEGTTEISLPDGSAATRFEWHKGSLFAIPMNARFQLVNARNTRALLIVGNTAPHIMNTFDDLNFVFNNPYHFTNRYDGSADFFTPNTETLATPELGRAMWRTNLIPDIVNCELPLDNQRSPGYRRIEPTMAGGYFWCFVGQFVAGRYSKAHSHPSGAVLICLTGRGYTYNWPSTLGIHPWADGHGDQVERVDYVAGGMVAAAPGGGNWFHQHFPASAEPMRMLVFYGGPPGTQYMEYGGRNQKGATWLNADIEDGGRSISYRTEDPHVREEYARMLAEVGMKPEMPEDIYS